MSRLCAPPDRGLPAAQIAILRSSTGIARADLVAAEIALIASTFARNLLAALFGAAAKLFARLRALLARAATVLLLSRRIAIAHALAMLGIVLPLTVLLRAVVDVGIAAVVVDLVAIEVVVAIDVDVDVAVAPVAVAPERSADEPRPH